MKKATHGLTKVLEPTEKRSHFRDAKSCAHPLFGLERRTWSFSNCPNELRVCRHWSVHIVGNVLSTTAYSSIVHRARHAKHQRGFDHRSVGISDRSVGDLRLTGGKFWKKLEAASRIESFFSLSLEREWSADETANRSMYIGATVFDWRQKFCESAARLDGLGKLSARSNGVEGQIKPEIERHGPNRVRWWCINASVTCDSPQNKVYGT